MGEKVEFPAQRRAEQVMLQRRVAGVPATGSGDDTDPLNPNVVTGPGGHVPDGWEMCPHCEGLGWYKPKQE